MSINSFFFIPSFLNYISLRLFFFILFLSQFCICPISSFLSFSYLSFLIFLFTSFCPCVPLFCVFHSFFFLIMFRWVFFIISFISLSHLSMSFSFLSNIPSFSYSSHSVPLFLYFVSIYNLIVFSCIFFIIFSVCFISFSLSLSFIVFLTFPYSPINYPSDQLVRFSLDFHPFLMHFIITYYLEYPALSGLEWHWE